MRDAFIARLTQEVERDDRIILITGDLGFGVLTEFAEQHPRSYLNAGVAEQNMTMLATGLAMEGRVAFTYSIANFPILRCLEMVRNDACYHGADVKIVSIGGGLSYGALGISHHATEDLAIMRALPGCTVIAPSDIWEVEEATSALIRHPGTCYLRLDKSKARENTRPGEVFELGRARVVREGDALTFITAGGILEEVYRAADHLASEGVEARILSIHTVKPLDRDAVVAAARETGGVITVEEHVLDGGLGSAVGEALLDAGVVPRAWHRIALRDGFSSIVGSQQYLRQRYGLDADAIYTAAHSALSVECGEISGHFHRDSP